jgi:hypothetical protein
MVKQYQMELVFNFFTFIIMDSKDVVNKKSVPITIGTLLSKFY